VRCVWGGEGCGGGAVKSKGCTLVTAHRRCAPDAPIAVQHSPGTAANA
jgi:hypothetical protein